MKLKFNRWYVVGVVDMVQFNSTFQRLHSILEFFQKSIFWKPCESTFISKIQHLTRKTIKIKRIRTNERNNKRWFHQTAVQFFLTQNRIALFSRESSYLRFTWFNGTIQFYIPYFFSMFFYGCNSIENFYISNTK